jgi:hypothetical protein
MGVRNALTARVNRPDPPLAASTTALAQQSERPPAVEHAVGALPAATVSLTDFSEGVQTTTNARRRSEMAESSASGVLRLGARVGRGSAAAIRRSHLPHR